LNRINALLEDTLFKESLARIEKWEQKREFCRHDLRHFLDVARIAYILLLESGEISKFMEEHNFSYRSAREIVYVSALLHDIGRWKQYETGEDHAQASASMAVEILKRAGFGELEISLATEAIREHRQKGGDRTLLGASLFRGDKLSRMCFNCGANNACNKFDEMITGQIGLLY